jgi:hypothetical protein
MSNMCNAGGRSAQEVEAGASVNMVLKALIRKMYEPLMRQRDEFDGVPGIQCFELDQFGRSGSDVPTFRTIHDIEAQRRAGALGWDLIVSRLANPTVVGEMLFGTTVGGALYTYVAILPMSG